MYIFIHFTATIIFIIITIILYSLLKHAFAAGLSLSPSLSFYSSSSSCFSHFVPLLLLAFSSSIHSIHFSRETVSIWRWRTRESFSLFLSVRDSFCSISSVSLSLSLSSFTLSFRFLFIPSHFGPLKERRRRNVFSLSLSPTS